MSGSSRPHSRTQSHSGNNSPKVDEVPPEEGGLLSYKHPPNFSEVMGFDLALDGGGYSNDQQFLPSGLNGDWQSDRDMRHRREMIQHM